MPCVPSLYCSKLKSAAGGVWSLAPKSLTEILASRFLVSAETLSVPAKEDGRIKKHKI